jgi:ribosomal protein L37AE/L43A
MKCLFCAENIRSRRTYQKWGKCRSCRSTIAHSRTIGKLRVLKDTSTIEKLIRGQDAKD